MREQDPTNAHPSAQIPRVRAVRTLIIEGPEEWVVETLARCWVTPDEPQRLQREACVREPARSLHLLGEPFDPRELERLEDRIQARRQELRRFPLIPPPQVHQDA